MRARWLFFLLFVSLASYAEIKIVPSSAWKPTTFNGTWINNEGCSVSSSSWGDSYYNPNWQDMSKKTTIQSKGVWRYFYIGPSVKRDWSFNLPISNLNAEKNYSYYSTSNKNLKQQSHQIYWGISIGYKVGNETKNVYFWLSRSNRDLYSNGTPTYSSEKYINCSVGSDGWKNTYYDYPSCAQSASPLLQIFTYTYGFTKILWGGYQVTSINSYVDEITYIKVMVGTQAQIQIGQPSAFGSSLTSKPYDATDLIEKEQYSIAISKLYQSNGIYYEYPAANLAICYLFTGQPDKAMELSNALIKFGGETMPFAYYIRGAVREFNGNLLDAIEDYKQSGSFGKDDYNRLSNKIYKTHTQNHSQNNNTVNNNTNQKPILTK